jgi:hypothetical protein
MFHGTFTVELRGALMEVVYRRLIDGDIQWEFCEERLNTSLRLTAQERREIKDQVIAKKVSDR